MITIAFVYSIYQEKLKNSTWILLTIAIIVTSVLWINSICQVTKIDKEKIKNEIMTELKTSTN